MEQQAHRLAGHIDPAPGTRWAPVGTLHQVDDAGATADGFDPATAFRRWPHDTAEHDQALQTMRDGSLYTFSVRDGQLHYRMSARPIFTAAVPLHDRGKVLPEKSAARCGW